MDQIQLSNNLVVYHFIFQVISVKQIGHSERRYKSTNTSNLVNRIPKRKEMGVTFYNPVSTKRLLLLT